MANIMEYWTGWIIPCIIVIGYILSVFIFSYLSRKQSQLVEDEEIPLNELPALPHESDRGIPIDEEPVPSDEQLAALEKDECFDRGIMGYAKEWCTIKVCFPYTIPSN